MPSKYWIKLYHEILDDPKMMRMDEVIFGRCIKIFLLAGKMDNDGYLPSIEDIAWHLRIELSEVEETLLELERVNIIIRNGDRWLVRRFAARNEAMTSADKMRYRRQELRSQEYHNTPLPNGDHGVTHGVTFSNTESDIDRESNRKETEEESEKTPHIAASPDSILCQASGLSAFPADQLQWIEVVIQLTKDHGDDETVAAMKRACERWVSTLNKNKLPYKKTDLRWINWAQEELAADNSKPKDTSQMTNEELVAYYTAKEKEHADNALSP